MLRNIFSKLHGYNFLLDLKRFLYILKIIIVVISALFCAGLIAIQSPKVQTKIVQKIGKNLTEKIDGDLSFSSMHLRPFKTLIIKDLVIIDKNPYTPENLNYSDVDTLFYAQRILATFSLRSLIGQEGFHFSNAVIQNARMNLVIEDNKSVNLTRMFRLNNIPKKEPNNKEIFSIRNVEIDNMKFRMINHQTDKPRMQWIYSETGEQLGIDWNDLDVRNIHIKAKNMRFKGGIMTGAVESMDFNERSGYICESLTGEARVGRGAAIIKNLHLDDPWSDLFLNLFEMHFDSVADFSDFLNKIWLVGDIANSSLDFKSIAYFAPSLRNTDIKLFCKGKTNGYVSSLNFNNINFKSAYGGFSGTINGRMTGVPDPYNMKFDCRLSNCRLNSSGLEKFVNAWIIRSGNLDNLLHLSQYAQNVDFTINADVDGYLNSLHVVPEIKSTIGELSGDIDIDKVLDYEDQIEIGGQIQTQNLNIGEILNIDLVKECSLHSGLRMKMASSNEPLSLGIDSLLVSSLNIKDYSYTNLAATGKISEEGFDGKIICSDPNLSFLFQGIFAPSKKSGNSIYKFYANVGYADLQALNIDTRGRSRIEFRTNANFYKTENEDLLGHINIDNIALENNSGRRSLGRINVNSIMTESTNRIRLNSDFLNGTYTGTGSILHFLKDLKEVCLKKELPALYQIEDKSKLSNEGNHQNRDRSQQHEDRSQQNKDGEYQWSGKEYEIKLNCQDSRELLAFVMPGLYIADSTSFSLGINKQGLLTTKLYSPRLAIGDKYLKGIKINADNSSDNIKGNIHCDEIKYGTIELINNNLMILADDNHIGLGYSFDNGDEHSSRGEILARGDLQRTSTDSLCLNVQLLPSAINLNEKRWNIHDSNLSYSEGDFVVDNFAVSSADERISVKGGISQYKSDTLLVNMDLFDISVINPLIKPDLALEGIASGTAKVISPFATDKGLLLDLVCDSSKIAGEDIGKLYAHSDWNQQFNRFDVNIYNNLNDKQSILLDAYYTPSTRYLEANAKFNEANVGYAKPFLVGIFDQMEGKLFGEVNLIGDINNLDISSKDTFIKDAWVNVEYINVPFNVEGAFHMDNYGGHFDNVTIKDRFGAQGTVNGAITYDHFRDLGLDVKIRANQMEVMNTTERMNPDFYGRLFATGNLNITGPLNNILLDIEAVTAKQGQIHIPVPNTNTAGNTNLLRFKQKETKIKLDPYELMLSEYKNKKISSSSDLSVKLSIGASPSVEAFIEIDKESGNILTGRGNGVIDLEVRPDVFSINGDYTISSGNYRFVALGLASRDFEIQEGSTVRFNGDIMESMLNIDAIYKTKASISTLISDTTSVSNRRLVECGINITDKLSNPRLGFSINIPDIDPASKSKVENALSTEDKIQKQFLSLIISNNFLPDEQSGIVNNSSVLYSNVSEIMSNQLNNILAKLDIPLDLGLNYQPSERGNNIFDVAVSTQLFNNRVSVNGNIGNRQYSGNNSNADVVGDIDIEIKLNKSGAFRLNLFSHSADQYSNYLDNTQRSGVGVAYQTEFNKISQFLKYVFSSRKKRQEAKEAEEKSMIDTGMKTIEIKKDE